MKSRLILFIHGLGGDGRSTWQSFPNLLKKDPIYLVNDIAFYNYPTSLFYLPFVSKSIKIQHLAMGLSTQITNEFAAYDSLTLVCHSLGGLIGRWYLMNEVKYNRALKVTHLLLYAVPNNGAQLASLAKYILFTHNQLRQLCKNSDFMEYLNEEWFRLKIASCVKIHYVLGGKDRIVDVASAKSFWGNNNVDVVVNKGHRNIVKPKYPNDMMAFLIFKRFLSADSDLPIEKKDVPLELKDDDRITNNNTKPMLADDLYRSYGGSLDEININEELHITEIHYGYGMQKECVRGNDLGNLERSVHLETATEYVDIDGGKRYVLKSLFTEQEVNHLLTNEKLHFPLEVTVKGKKTQPNNAIAIFLCRDIPYFEGCDLNAGDTFEIKCRFGRGGLAEFLDKKAKYQTWNPYVIGNEDNRIGSIGIMVAVEFDKQQPVCRSRYIVMLRKGIRYPEDVWWSKGTSKPLVSPLHADITETRFMFQSRAPSSRTTDIFVADFNGNNMRNLTETHQDAYDGFYNDDGEEVARWIDNTHIQYCSMVGGTRKTVIGKDAL